MLYIKPSKKAKPAAKPAEAPAAKPAAPVAAPKVVDNTHPMSADPAKDANLIVYRMRKGE